MKELVRKIINFGVKEDMPFRLQNKLRIFNSASIFISLINAGYGVAGLFVGWYLASLFSLISIAFLALGWVLIANKKYNQTFHLIMLYAFGFLFGYVWLFGEGTQSHLYFLFLPVASTIMFEQRKPMYVYLILTIISIFAIRLNYQYLPPHYETKPEALWIFGTLNTCFTAILIFTGVSLFKRENQNYSEEIEIAKQAIEEKNKEVTDSINYAGRIQKAIIPTEEEFSSYFSDAFILLKPKDIVSGDFYWAAKSNDSFFFAVADCTGHGVPGGFMTMLGISFLDEIVNEKKTSNPAEILNHLRDKIISSLRQTGASGENKDGMDIVLCRYDAASQKLFFAGANNSLYLVRNQDMTEYKTDKQPCGFYHKITPFTLHETALEKKDVVYLFTDGFPDQFGGFKGKKFKYRPLEELILKNNQLPMAAQREALNTTFANWKGDYDQVDDVLVGGVRF